MVHFRSSSWKSPDPILSGPFAFSAHYHGFCPQQRKVVWSLLLQDGSEGPAFINYTVTQTRRLSPARLLVAHLENQLQTELNLPGGGVGFRNETG